MDRLAIGQQHDPQKAIVHLGDLRPAADATVGLDDFAGRRFDSPRIHAFSIRTRSGREIASPGNTSGSPMQSVIPFTTLYENDAASR